MSSQAQPSFDIDFVRHQFPALQEPVLDGQAFFENAGGSYTCRPVIERLTRFYTQRKVQPYGPYDASRLGGKRWTRPATVWPPPSAWKAMSCPSAPRPRRTPTSSPAPLPNSSAPAMPSS